MLLSLVLFGSRARGDHRLSSDVDLLGVVDGGTIKEEVAARGTSFYQYPFGYLHAESRAGNLFLLHLIKEGKAIHDTAGIFERIADEFLYKEDYEAEILEASAVAWLLLDGHGELTARAFRKKLTWALRTVLIARAAESRHPIFSSSALEEFSDIRGLKQTIDRRFVVPSSELRDAATRIVSEFGFVKEDIAWPKKRLAQLEYVAGLGQVGRGAAAAVSRRRISKSALKVDIVSLYD